MMPLPFTPAFLKILMVARWSMILFVSFEVPYPHDSGTTTIMCLVYSGKVCLRKEGAASFLR
jgi:hypothetical protein